MIKHSFIPKWRGATEPIEVVLNPTKAWLDKLQLVNGGGRVLRFAVTCDGLLYFGDAYNVLHGDIGAVRGDDKECPLLVGSLVEVNGIWCHGTVQYSIAIGEDFIKSAQGFLPKFTEWVKFTKMLGYDPIQNNPEEQCNGC